MSRPQCCRRIGQEPPCAVFKPAGIPSRLLEEVVLTLDEFEALRLADLSGLYHEQAAASMNVSRQTFGRIIASARWKTAQALILGKALRIEGGKVEMNEMRRFKCRDCEQTWELPFGGGRPEVCPNCKSTNFCRESGAGVEGGGGQGRKRCCHRGGQSRQKQG
ncbi:MAG TPA: DUF134 domain-containing protein [Candidatus Bathyarchaeia archaeon]|nr:DUF134 domain-containing protein [Candidatus Bathyarchaeia archaeon]